MHRLLGAVNAEGSLASEDSPVIQSRLRCEASWSGDYSMKWRHRRQQRRWKALLHQRRQRLDSPIKSRWLRGRDHRSVRRGSAGDRDRSRTLHRTPDVPRFRCVGSAKTGVHRRATVLATTLSTSHQILNVSAAGPLPTGQTVGATPVTSGPVQATAPPPLTRSAQVSMPNLTNDRLERAVDRQLQGFERHFHVKGILSP